jgi:Protein of unknown function (DUF3631)
VEDRAAEIWEPLLALGDVAGGHWPESARAACRELALQAASEPQLPPLARLLRDISEAWEPGAPRMGSTGLIRRLFALPGAPWAAMWPEAQAAREMAALLRQASIEPAKMRINGAPPVMGYQLADIERARAGSATEGPGVVITMTCPASSVPLCACVAYGFLPTPPSAGTSGRLTVPRSGRHWWIGTTPGSTTCTPSKNRRTCSGRRT